MREKRQLYCSSLDRMVDLHIILPESAGNPNRRCPVLYFYDGDRIWDDPKVPGPSALSGSFCFREYSRAFGAFLPPVILVGIAPPPDMLARTAEYSPYTKRFEVPQGVRFAPLVEGRGKELGAWVVSELKPFIDAQYPTLSDADCTAIGGLSTSGVNALYMISAYPDVFHRFLIHAPALHLWMDRVLETVRPAAYSHVRRGYFDIGTDDATRMVQNGLAYEDLKTVIALMKQNGLSPDALRFFEIYRGTHECASWALTFPDALRWVFGDFAPGASV